MKRNLLTGKKCLATVGVFFMLSTVVAMFGGVSAEYSEVFFAPFTGQSAMDTSVFKTGTRLVAIGVGDAPGKESDQCAEMKWNVAENNGVGAGWMENLNQLQGMPSQVTVVEHDYYLPYLAAGDEVYMQMFPSMAASPQRVAYYFTDGKIMDTDKKTVLLDSYPVGEWFKMRVRIYGAAKNRRNYYSHTRYPLPRLRLQYELFCERPCQMPRILRDCSAYGRYGHGSRLHLCR